MYIRENNWKPVFHIWAKMYILLGARGGGGGGHSMIRLSLSSSPAIISPIFMYTWNKETIWKELLKLKSKIWKKKNYIWGGPGGPLLVQMPNDHFQEKHAMASLWTFLVDSSSLSNPESESAGCQLGTLGEFFLEAKNKMAAGDIPLNMFWAISSLLSHI